MVEASSRPVAKIRVSTRIFSDSTIRELAQTYATPLFVMDEETLRRKVSELEVAFSGFKGPLRVAYSMKANFNPAVVKTFVSESILFDVCSLGELYFYQRCGGAPENVVYTSVTEEEQEFEGVLKAGVSRIAVSSYNGLTNLKSASRKTGFQAKVLVRIDPEVEVRAGIRASFKHGKFGVPLYSGTQDNALNMIKELLRSSSLTFEGFHFHLGSQIVDPHCFVESLEKLELFITEARKEIPQLEVRVLDIGGGTPVAYSGPVPTPKEIGSLLVGKLNEMAERLGSNFTLIIESGRYVVAEACILITKVLNIKDYGDHKYVFVDAGYHLLLDSALLGQPYPQEVLPREPNNKNNGYKLAGRLCDSYDVFPISSKSNLAGASVGKLVIFRNVGAYSIVFNMPFHCQTKPAILMRKMNGEFTTVREAQTIEQLYEEEGGGSEINAFSRLR